MYTHCPAQVVVKRQPNARGEGDALRDQLVAAAGDLLLDKQQIALPSLRAVARSCHVLPAAVYLHFDSQQALVAAIVKAQISTLRQHIEAALTAGFAREQLRQFGAAYVEWSLAHPGAYQLLFENADRLGVGHEHDERGDSSYLLARGARLLAEARPGAQAELGSLRLWVGLHGIVSLRLHKPYYSWPPLAVEIERVIASELD